MLWKSAALTLALMTSPVFAEDVTQLLSCDGGPQTVVVPRQLQGKFLLHWNQYGPEKKEATETVEVDAQGVRSSTLFPFFPGQDRCIVQGASTDYQTGDLLLSTTLVQSVVKSVVPRMSRITIVLRVNPKTGVVRAKVKEWSGALLFGMIPSAGGEWSTEVKAKRAD